MKRKAMLEMVRTMKEGICDHPDAERLILELATQLETAKGKKSYGYLPKPQKKLVDKIVNEMERLPSVKKCYEQWMILQGKVDAYYHDKEQKRVPLSQQKEFRSIKNAVIKEAENIRQCKLFFEDKGVEQESEPEQFRNASYDYWTLRDVIRDESLTLEERGDAVSELETLARTGDKHAQYLMGKLYLMGQGVDYDKQMGIHWLTKSAVQGNVYAELLLQHQNSGRPPNVFLGVTRLLHHMGRIFQERSLQQSNPGGIQIDRKRLEVLQEKREAHGLKGNVYEEYRGPNLSM